MSRHPATPPRRPPLLSRERRLVVYGIGVGVWLSGALWVLAHYFLVSEGEFGTTAHPLEVWSLAGHGAFAFAALWLFGLLWGVHVTAGWKTSRRRWSGGFMFGLMVWLILSGYLLYYVGSDELMSVIMLLHWTTGLAAPIPFLLHRFASQTSPQPG